VPFAVVSVCELPESGELFQRAGAWLRLGREAGRSLAML
jgi:hypothetical protein